MRYLSSKIFKGRFVLGKYITPLKGKIGIIFGKDEDISIFFDYIYLIASYEVKSMARQGKEREVLNLLKISEIVKTYRNYFKSLNLDYTTLIVSLFYKIKNV